MPAPARGHRVSRGDSVRIGQCKSKRTDCAGYCEGKRELHALHETHGTGGTQCRSDKADTPSYDRRLHTLCR